ncbi:MAG: hypothetical protein ACJAVR_001416 [Paracoccaceae bacterium]|jgi:uncharacterized protein YjiS (DUF1127 family)
MAVFSTDHIANAPETGHRGTFADWTADLRARFAKWRLYRRTMRELGDLSNAELADMGMARPGIPFVAWHAVYG